ncbi:MAG: cytochrome c [Rhodobiaceae bacterium]|nr:cytochrome c [Rhodobiaceae bacterium]MCC0012838.1 cytochrome c [Rhodobiaceae bacterium]MCC0060135.1 cytochrome c [Rhodobiaceae bacterium]
MNLRNVVILLAIVMAGVAVYRMVVNRTAAPTASVSVVVPELLGDAQAGKALFDANCAECHGTNASGTNAGPPLVHKIYEPNHHGDMAFLLAAKQGVRAHHWPFGDMPPVPGVSEQDVGRIVAYVRTLQKANGIF